MKYLRFIPIFFLLLFFGNKAEAQKGLMHSTGANYLYFIGSNSVNGVYGVEYSPRYNFLAEDKLSVGVGTHATLGFSYDSNFGSSFMFFMPLLANVNFGAFSTEDNDQDFGGFLEGGYNFGWLGGNGESIFIHGPIVSTGIRFHGGFLNEIGFYYMKPVGLEDTHTVGLRLAVIFN